MCLQPLVSRIPGVKTLAIMGSQVCAFMSIMWRIMELHSFVFGWALASDILAPAWHACQRWLACNIVHTAHRRGVSD